MQEKPTIAVRLGIQLFTCNLKPISDIDECVVDTHHNCSSDAFCNNTHGSFNCTCKPGFTGDGENCTGRVGQDVGVDVCDFAPRLAMLYGRNC